MSNKTSDENVVNDIKILNKFCEYEDAVVLTEDALEEVQDALQNILAEREQKDKRIKELEADLYSANEIISDLIDNIPKQVVIDAINKHKLAYEELGIKYTNTHYEDDEKRARDFYMIVTEDRIIQVLQELLGEEKNRNV